ncbi:PREDICTED: meprin A subunit alpha-like [Acropora digitifera]|uniref:meprin A subunit alpha-like n=1 Tax=Acropora digitifera TaxID=70779 RepID=UPI00077A22F3|nr:PREDICTED: meprin A subunit alpha-like [Acropora digitifera]
MVGDLKSFAFLSFLAIFVTSLYGKPLTDEMNSNKRAVDRNFDDEIEEISKREFDSVHGRILAVNMAHIRRKRQVPSNVSGGDENSFKGIEQANKGNMSKYFQGDIQLDFDTEVELKNGTTGDPSRNAIRTRKRLWTDRVIPFYIPSFMSHIESNLYKAIFEIQSKTCLRFKRLYRRRGNYIDFGNDDGCSSKVGKRYASVGSQTISLGRGCNHVAIITHELMHAIGFFHEQSRSDRDKYIKVYWENILSGFADQFEKYTWRTIDDLGVSYDFKSIMHYDRRAFTKDGKPTIEAIGNENMEFGNSKGELLSYKDVLEVKALYDCQSKCLCSTHRVDYAMRTETSTYVEQIKRYRRCNNPKPQHGGRQCSGSGEEAKMCIVKRCHLDRDDTDFEPPLASSGRSQLGMWTNAVRNAPWTLRRGFTPSFDTGPTGDHTTGKGYYLYVESSSLSRGQEARLVSPNLPAQREGQCLKFYYSMYGSTMGTLKVQIKKSNGNSWLIFYKSGNQGTGWKRASGNINVGAGFNYQLAFIGTVGGTSYSDFAIDDVYIDPGLCNCQDNYHTCYLWARKGQCASNRKWMRDHCKRSCKVCTATVAPTRPITAAPATTPITGCVDTNPTNCPGWAAQGDCKKNPKYMQVHCCKSCASCTDKNSKYCPRWAANGECTKNPGHMIKTCCEACATCVDKNPTQCPLWAANGECKKTAAYMNINCCKACATRAASCADKYPTQCPLWAANGECKKAPAFMKKNCCNSCANCVNMNPVQCPRWARNGECKKSPAYMVKNCCQSCAAL